MITNVQLFRDKIYEELAVITKALGSAKRLEMLDLLAQGPLSVEKIAIETNTSVANTSKHLQVLKSAKVVEVIRRGNFIDYSLSGENVYNAWAAIRELGEAYNGEIKNILTDFRGSKSEMKGVTAEELLKKIYSGNAVILDVRPENEYKRAHIHKAISLPIEELEKKVMHLSKNIEIIAYCRGKFCFLADEAVSFLKNKGFNANRIEEGFSEWVMNGYPVDRGEI